LDLSALGDFPVSNRTSESLPIDAAGTALGFPSDTLAIEATADADFTPQPFIGLGERFAERFDFLLWPEGHACELFRPGPSDSFPGKLGGQALGYSKSSGLVMAAGSNDSSSAAIVGALTFDTRTGESYLVDPRKRQVLTEPRAFATVSDFGGKILVAGGENPIHERTQEANQLRASAEVYDPSLRTFEQDLIALAEATTHQAAVTLENGETLLMGGRDEGSDASRVVQVVSPATRVSKLIDSLSVGRNAPTALRLSDGRVLIGGGTDANGQPIGALELRDRDASRLDPPWDGSLSLPARFGRAFIGLPGGAALAVGGCEDRAAAAGETCATWCTQGCPPEPDPITGQRYDAFWITADGSVTQLDFPLSAPRPILLPGSDGRPWLIASGLDQFAQPLPDHFALYRFDPWQKQFVASDLELELGESLTPASFAPIGVDAFAWLDSDADGPVLRGARLGLRSAFSNDVPLVALRDGAGNPAHLAPDHPPGTDLKYDGSLELSAAASAAPACVWVTDAEYADFSAQIQFSSDDPPSLRLGPQLISATEPGQPGAPCELPSTGAPGTIHVRRKGTLVSFELGGASGSCALDSSLTGRVAFAICQSALTTTTVTKISVTRGG
jgi:hypothetical protein